MNLEEKNTNLGLDLKENTSEMHTLLRYSIVVIYNVFKCTSNLIEKYTITVALPLATMLIEDRDM